MSAWPDIRSGTLTHPRQIAIKLEQGHNLVVQYLELAFDCLAQPDLAIPARLDHPFENGHV